LVERGDDVRVILRPTSSTKAVKDLDVEYHFGDVFDDATLRTAMAGPRSSTANTYPVAADHRGRKTGSGLRMPSADAGSTI
jgi:nucleoside-diphosphate-sugar epimerase